MLRFQVAYHIRKTLNGWEPCFKAISDGIESDEVIYLFALVEVIRNKMFVPRLDVLILFITEPTFDRSIL